MTRCLSWYRISWIVIVRQVIAHEDTEKAHLQISFHQFLNKVDLLEIFIVLWPDDIEDGDDVFMPGRRERRSEYKTYQTRFPSG
jgi:hypothetical protein